MFNVQLAHSFAGETPFRPSIPREAIKWALSHQVGYILE